MPAAADRVAPGWTAGGCRTGSPTAFLAGVGQGRCGPGGRGRHKGAGHDRRSGSPPIGRPAGLCQGRPLLLGSPLDLTSLYTLLGDAGHRLGCSRDSVGVCRSNGGKVDGRRRVSRQVGRRRWRRRDGTAVRAVPGGAWWVGRPDAKLYGVVVAAVGVDMNQVSVAIRSATLSFGFSKTPFLTLSISTSARRQGDVDFYTGGPEGAEMCS